MHLSVACSKLLSFEPISLDSIAFDNALGSFYAVGFLSESCAVYGRLYDAYETLPDSSWFKYAVCAALPTLLLF